MRQCPALQIDEGLLPSRMHYFEDERMSVCARQMEVVVVFAWQRPRGGLQPVKFARQVDGFRFGHRLSYASLPQHAPNLIRKSRSASIPDGSRIPARCSSARNPCGLEFLPRLLDGNWPIHSREPDHRRCAAVLDAAMLVIPGFSRIIANARLATYRRVVPRFDHEAGLIAARHHQRQGAILRIGGGDW